MSTHESMPPLEPPTPDTQSSDGELTVTLDLADDALPPADDQTFPSLPPGVDDGLDMPRLSRADTVPTQPPPLDDELAQPIYSPCTPPTAGPDDPPAFPSLPPCADDDQQAPAHSLSVVTSHGLAYESQQRKKRRLVFGHTTIPDIAWKESLEVDVDYTLLVDPSSQWRIAGVCVPSSLLTGELRGALDNNGVAALARLNESCVLVACSEARQLSPLPVQIKAIYFITDN